MPTRNQEPPDVSPRQNKGFEMVNSESSLQLQRLLALLKNKALESSSERDEDATSEAFPRSVAKKGSEMVDLEVSSRLQRLLETLTGKTVDGLIEWEEQLRSELFLASIGRSSFTV